MTVINIEDYQPHLVMECEDAIHVLPVSLLRDVVNGSKDSTILTEPVVKQIISQFLTDNDY